MMDVVPERKQLIYENNFNSPACLDDWILEGPGVVTVDKGKLLMFSKFQPELEKIWEESRHQNESFHQCELRQQEWLTSNFAATYPDMVNTRQYDKKEYPHGYFEGGHLVLWNKTETPENFYVEHDFQPLSRAGLFIIIVSAKGVHGEDIFHPALNKRNGVFTHYILGDINTYHFSYFANAQGNARGTTNLRKNSGFHLVASGPDLVPQNTTSTHKIQVLRQNSTISFFVDNQLSVSYCDNGTFGPPLGGGKIGLRSMIWGKAYFSNFKIYGLP